MYSCYTLASILLYRIRIPRICQYLKPGRHDSAKNCHTRREAFFTIFISFAFRKKTRKKCSKNKALHWTQIKVIFDIFLKLCFIFLSFEIDFTESPWGILLKCYIAFILSQSYKRWKNTWLQLKYLQKNRYFDLI